MQYESHHTKTCLIGTAHTYFGMTPTHVLLMYIVSNVKLYKVGVIPRKGWAQPQASILLATMKALSDPLV